MTCIVGIRTPQIAVIAADSKGTFKGNNPESVRSVCKIFRVSEAGFAIAGLIKDPESGFDLEKIVAETLWQRASISMATVQLRERLVSLLTLELKHLKDKKPALFKESMKDDYVCSLLIAAWEKEQPVMNGLGFKASEDDRGQMQIDTSLLCCPGNCPEGVYTFFLGARNGIDHYVANHGMNIGMSPEDGAPFLVGLEIKAGTEGVGLPIDVLAITGVGVKWLARKDECGDHPIGFSVAVS